MAQSTTSTAAVILAAGKGTRMKSTLPKVMHKVAGLPMIGHCVTQALNAGCAPIALVTAPGMEDVAKAARAIGGEIDIATQKEQLGTAHAVLAARAALGELEGNLLVLYGDTPLITAETITTLLSALEEEKDVAVAVLGFVPEDAGAYGRLVLGDDGSLERIVEAKDASDEELEIELCNSGVIALRGSVAWELLKQIKNENAKGEYYLTDVVALARAAGYRAVAVEAEAEEVMGVNSRSELAVAEAIFQYRARQRHMENGVTLIDPDSVFFAADTAIAPDVLIEPNVFFGPGVSIGSGVHIKAFSHIEGAKIEKNAIVGPFARLRPGTALGKDVKVGNFVEIKAAEVGDGAKISHLSYIGDASVGSDANIGAGTITCNYDGFNKHRTVIGREVFVGSNSALVAPLTIGDGAMIAAGSTITEDIAPDALGLARTRQQVKSAWASDFRAKQEKK